MGGGAVERRGRLARGKNGLQEEANVGRTLGQQIADRIARIRNRKFLDSAMAAAALVSTADADVRLSEQVVLDKILETLDELNVYDPHLGVDLHRSYVDEIQSDPEAGVESAFGVVAEFRDDPEHATLLLSLAICVSKADAIVCNAERAILERLCRELSLPAEETLARVLS